MEWIIRKTYPAEGMEVREKEGVPFLVFPMLERTGLVKQGFSTRLGGVSRGEFRSMNLTSTRGDDPEAVQENYRRIAQALEIPADRIVLARQTHTTNIRVATEEDAGKGYTRERDYDQVDGLITNVPELPLVTFYADCIPLYFLDPVKKAIGLSHAGWRGTVAKMAAETVSAMEKTFGSRPEDILAGIGPGICPSCYEVGTEVAEAFYRDWPEAVCREILQEKSGGKYHLDLKLANAACMESAGIRREHISIADQCTCCNPEILFSHRASQGRRGNLGAFLCLKGE